MNAKLTALHELQSLLVTAMAQAIDFHHECEQGDYVTHVKAADDIRLKVTEALISVNSALKLGGIAP